MKKTPWKSPSRAIKPLPERKLAERSPAEKILELRSAELADAYQKGIFLAVKKNSSLIRINPAIIPQLSRDLSLLQLRGGTLSFELPHIKLATITTKNIEEILTSMTKKEFITFFEEIEKIRTSTVH
ncbi:MAG: hypothetical protein NUV57_05800 [archaeon]|nr:hypothetical protein [archaeon]